MARSPATFNGLPEEVRFCKRCVMSNQRPASFPEFRHTSDRITPTLHIDEDGICDACHHEVQKQNIDWETREQELIKLLDRHRRNDGRYDCIIPGSGGKDSDYAAHVLKYKYGMHPLTVTWPPIIYTDIGWQNFQNWLKVGGFDNITFTPNGKTHRLLTKLAIENLLHPFQTFILGQKNLAPKIAIQHDVTLIFYGENEAEYGNPVADNASSLRDKSFYSIGNLSDVFIGGVSVPELIEVHGLSLADLMPYFPLSHQDFENADTEVHYLGYYMKWTPQENYYHAVEHCGFEANPTRSEGTYSKYASLDDRIDGLHYYTTYIKFGLGRATYDSAQEVRNKHLTREEAVALVHQFDGEFPKKYFNEVLDYLGMDPERFLELCDEYRSPHLWEWAGDRWKLRHQVS